MVNADEGWAMGEDWIHWNGTNWAEAPDAAIIPIYSVFMVNSGDGWAVGALGTILHWDGVQWTYVESSTMYVFYSVFMTSVDDGWAVGEWGTLVPQNYTTVDLHWDGNQWTEVGGPTRRPIYSVFMVNSGDGWAVGALGTILHWDGVQWIPEYPETIEVVFTLGLMLVAIVLTKIALKRRESLCTAIRENWSFHVKLFQGDNHGKDKQR
jgi:photosystem II stability/assembly factor-like uncharacterized protein